MGTRYIQEVNELNFDSTVLAASKPVLLDFTAEWCSPCRALGRILAPLAEERTGRLLIASVDSDANPGLAAQYNVRGMPTLVLLVAGKEVGRRIGLTTREHLVGWLDRTLADTAEVASLY
jgi:thioredoxin 1